MASELREFARDQECTGNIPGKCNYDNATTILAHFRPGFYGMSIKPQDVLAAHLCSCCHDVLDGRDSNHEFSIDELMNIWHSAIVKTLRRITGKYEVKVVRLNK